MGVSSAVGKEGAPDKASRHQREAKDRALGMPATQAVRALVMGSKGMALRPWTKGGEMADSMRPALSRRGQEQQLPIAVFPLGYQGAFLVDCRAFSDTAHGLPARPRALQRPRRSGQGAPCGGGVFLGAGGGRGGRSIFAQRTRLASSLSHPSHSLPSREKVHFFRLYLWIFASLWSCMHICKTQRPPPSSLYTHTHTRIQRGLPSCIVSVHPTQSTS